MYLNINISDYFNLINRMDDIFQSASFVFNQTTPNRNSTDKSTYIYMLPDIIQPRKAYNFKRSRK